jgi:hypothetical protein
MKKFIMTAIFGCLISQTTFASSQEEMASAYQEGLKSSDKGTKDQQLWAQGKSNPEMAKTYQEGLNPEIENG